MPVDVDAAVISNTRLSADYNVLALAAPEIAALARTRAVRDGQAVARLDPLLRRPFSIFEILRDADGAADRHLDPQQARRRRHDTALRSSKPGARMPCLGPLGRPFEPVDPPAEAWMVAGGVGLAPFVTLAEALARAEDAGDAVLRRAPRARAVLRRALRSARRRAWCSTTEDGSRGARAASPSRSTRRSRAAPRRQPRQAVRLRPDADDARCRAARRRRTAARATCRSNRSWAAVSAAATAASCRPRPTAARRTTSRIVHRRPGLRRARASSGTRWRH